MKKKIKIRIGIPKELGVNEEQIESLRKQLVEDIDGEADVDFQAEMTEGEFYTKIVEDEEEVDNKEEVSEEMHENLSKDDDLVIDDFDGGEESIAQPKCEIDCCHCPELTNLEKNIALLKLYLGLRFGGVCQLDTEFGSFILTSNEQDFLLDKLFKETGLDKCAKKMTSLLEDTHI